MRLYRARRRSGRNWKLTAELCVAFQVLAELAEDLGYDAGLLLLLASLLPAHRLEVLEPLGMDLVNRASDESVIGCFRIAGDGVCPTP